MANASFATALQRSIQSLQSKLQGEIGTDLDLDHVHACGTWLTCSSRFITVHILQGPEVPTWKGPLSFPHPFADDGFEHEANYPRDDDTIITRRQPSTIVNELVGIFHALNLRPEARLAEGLSLDLRGLSSEQITQLKDQLPAVQKLRTKSIMLYEPTTSGVGFIISHCDPLTLRHAHYYDRFSGDPTGWLLTPHGSTLTRLRAPTFAELDHDEFNLEEFTQGFPNLERLVLDSYATFAGCIDPTMRTEVSKLIAKDCPYISYKAKISSSLIVNAARSDHSYRTSRGFPSLGDPDLARWTCSTRSHGRTNSSQ